MPTMPQSIPSREDGHISAKELQSRIGKSVLKSLGLPGDLLSVRVHPVGNDRYRANVFVGESADKAKISNSFFLSADPEGNILQSRPMIVKRY